MHPFESINKIDVYEIDGIDSIEVGKTPKITIKNHWNRGEFVVLIINNKKYTVLAHELERAIENAKNAHR